jgi:hypothetical protein
MASILYSAQTLSMSDDVNLEELAATIVDHYAKGAHAWITMDLVGPQPNSVRLLVGPGIPVAIVSELAEIAL